MKKNDASVIIGIASTVTESGRVSTTLHLATPFGDYFDNPEAGRTCVGQKVEAVYVGGYDCSSLSVGDTVEILYGKAITTAKGTFQPIKRIDVLS